MGVVVNLALLLGLVFAAGLCGGWLAGRKSPEIDSWTEQAASAVDHGPWLRNIGYLCGAVSAAAVLFAVWVLGWLRFP